MSIGRIILVSLALVGILMSLTTASAMYPPARDDGDACCQREQPPPPADSKQPQDGCADAGCIAACCRLICSVVDVPRDLTDESRAVAAAATWSIVAFDLTDADSIFHPPRL